MAELNGNITIKSNILSGSISNTSEQMNGELVSEGSLIGNFGRSFIRGKSIEYLWDDTKLGIRLEGQEEYQFVELDGKDGLGISTVTMDDNNIIVTFSDGTSMNAGQIKGEYDDTVIKQDIKSVKNEIESFTPLSNLDILEILSK